MMYHNIVYLYIFILINVLNKTIFISSSILTIDSQSLKDTLDNAITVTKRSIENIYNEWQIDKYPKFLKSCYMHKVYFSSYIISYFNLYVYSITLNYYRV